MGEGVTESKGRSQEPSLGVSHGEGPVGKTAFSSDMD